MPFDYLILPPLFCFSRPIHLAISLVCKKSSTQQILRHSPKNNLQLRLPTLEINCPRTHRSRDRCGGGISLMPPRETGHKNLRIFSFRCDQRMIDSSDCSQKALFTLSQNINRIPTVMHMEYK